MSVSSQTSYTYATNGDLPLNGDAYKVVETRIRTMGLKPLIEAQYVVPINLVPLAGADYVPWDEDLKTLWGGPCPPQVITSMDAANQAATRRLTLSAFPAWMKCRDIFELRDHPGVYVIPQAFSAELLDDLADKCRDEYPFIHETETNLGQLTRQDAVNLFTSKRRLRWISLGCNYDWTKRVYTSRSALPSELSTRAKDIANIFGFWPNYKPDCALINYYGWNDRLRGHTDDVEEAMEMPLITISMGQPGIFLMGGHTRQQKPDALVLRHGDCCIMSQDSRADFHGVPSLLFYHQGSQAPAHCRQFSRKLLCTQRVNISIRQCWR